MRLVLLEGFWYVHILFGSYVKIQSFQIFFIRA